MGFEESEVHRLLDKFMNGVDFTAPATHVSLHTADPSDGTEDEVTGGSYARQQVNQNGGASPAWDLATGGIVDNGADIDFNDMPATTVTHVGIYDAATAGNLLASGALDANKTTAAGDTLRFPTGDLDIQIT